MEAIMLNLPDALEEDVLLRMPATWEEYVGAVDSVPYTVQFLNSELIMSQATAAHETIVGILIWLFNNSYLDHNEYRVIGSNIKIVIPGQEGDVNAALSVVKEPVEYGTTSGGRTTEMRIKNPEIVVEVLSKSTRKFDLEEKLSYYKLIPSLQHILFVDQYRPFASVYTRTDVPDEWLNHDYRTLESVIKLGDLSLPLTTIYRKTTFTT